MVIELLYPVCLTSNASHGPATLHAKRSTVIITKYDALLRCQVFDRRSHKCVLMLE